MSATLDLTQAPRDLMITFQSTHANPTPSSEIIRPQTRQNAQLVIYRHIHTKK